MFSPPPPLSPLGPRASASLIKLPKTALACLALCCPTFKTPLSMMVIFAALLGLATAVPHSGAGKVEVKFFAEAVRMRCLSSLSLSVALRILTIFASAASQL